MRPSTISLLQTVAPSVEPVSTEELKTWLGYGGTDQDATFDGLIKAARSWAEDFTNRQFITATWQLKLNCFLPVISLPKIPLQSISSITYVDTENATQTLSTASYQYSVETGDLTTAYNISWPTVLNTLEPITITYVSGYGDDPHHVPEAIRTAIKLRAASLWGSVQMAACGQGGGCGGGTMDAAKSLLWPYRDMVI